MKAGVQLAFFYGKVYLIPRKRDILEKNIIKGVVMAIEKIIEFSKGNKFKVKLEVGDIDTSTVVDVEIEDKELEQIAPDEFSFDVVEKFVSEEGYNFETTATWVIYLEDDGLGVYKDGSNGFRFTGKVPEGASVDDLYLDFEPYYDVVLNYEKIEEETGEGASSVTLTCETLSGEFDSYIRSVNPFQVNLTEDFLKVTANWFANEYFKGEVTPEEIIRGDKNEEILMMLDEEVFNNVTIFNESASKEYSQTVGHDVYYYGCEAKSEFVLGGITVKAEFEPVEKYIESLRERDDAFEFKQLLEETELNNLFTEQTKETLEELKTEIRYRRHSLQSLTFEVDYALVRNHARIEGIDLSGVSDGAIVRASQIMLENIANSHNKNPFIDVIVQGDKIWAITDVRNYDDNAPEYISLVEQATIEEDSEGVWRAKLGGYPCDYDEAKELAKAIEEVDGYKYEKKRTIVKMEEVIEEINQELQQCLPMLVNQSVISGEAEQYKSWLLEKLRLLEILGGALSSYSTRKRAVRDELLQSDIKRELGGYKSYFEEQLMEYGTTTLGLEEHTLHQALLDAISSKKSIEDFCKQEEKFHDNLSLEREQVEMNFTNIKEVLEEAKERFSDNESLVDGIQVVLDNFKRNHAGKLLDSSVIPEWNNYVGVPMG